MSEAMFEPDGGLYIPSGHAVGPWQSRSTADPRGVGLSESVLGDRDGPIARSFQALLLEPR